MEEKEHEIEKLTKEKKWKQEDKGETKKEL